MYKVYVCWFIITDLTFFTFFLQLVTNFTTLSVKYPKNERLLANYTENFQEIGWPIEAAQCVIHWKEGEEKNFTLCPCLPGSPDSPLIPLWPFTRKHRVKVNLKLYLIRRENKRWTECHKYKQSRRLSEILQTFLQGRPGCPFRLAGQALGHWKTQQPIWGHGRALPPGGSTDSEPR